METKAKNKFLDLGRKWANLLVVLLDPIVVIIFLLTILIFVYTGYQTDLKIITILSLAFSIFTGLLGGILSKKWDDLTQEKIIITRGKSANRSLQLLLGSTISLEKRVSLYLQRIKDERDNVNLNSEVIKTYLEEIIEECVSLEEEIVNSIQDWTDILPEVEVKNVLALIRELKGKIAAKELELQTINSRILLEKEASNEERNRLLSEKASLQDQIDKFRHEIFVRSNQVGVPVVGGSLITGGTIVGNRSLDSDQPIYDQTKPGIPYRGTPYIVDSAFPPKKPEQESSEKS